MKLYEYNTSKEDRTAVTACYGVKLDLTIGGRRLDAVFQVGIPGLCVPAIVHWPSGGIIQKCLGIWDVPGYVRSDLNEYASQQIQKRCEDPDRFWKVIDAAPVINHTLREVSQWKY